MNGKHFVAYYFFERRRDFGIQRTVSKKDD
jgi:hypothetical protein